MLDFDHLLHLVQNRIQSLVVLHGHTAVIFQKVESNISFVFIVDKTNLVNIHIQHSLVIVALKILCFSPQHAGSHL